MESKGTVELRVEVDEMHPFLAVADAICQADPAESRASITRRVLAEWAVRELHRATLVVRVAGRHGNGQEPGRKRAG